MMGGDSKFFPMEDDGYVCSLDERTKDAALAELREDDSTRSSAVQQLREWVLKHPDINKCRTDSVFLLRFLRTKKFSVPLAQEMLERYLTVRQLYPHWFRALSVDEPVLREILQAGYLVPLPRRDQLGRRVILRRAASMDPHKYTSADMVRVHSLVMECLMDDEESQVCGFVQVNDEAGLTMSHLSMWSLSDIANITKCFQKSFPMRHKSSKFVSLPHFTNKIMEFFVTLLNEKLKSRIEVIQDRDGLKKAINPEMLPKEYGGEMPLDQMISMFQKKLEERREAIEALDKMHIDLALKTNIVRDLEDELAGVGVAGSFRQLQLD